MLKNNRSTIYITEEGRETLDTAARNRGYEEMAKSELEMTTILENEIINMRNAQAKGADYLLYTIERKTGKTTVILALAAKWGIPIVADGDIKRFTQSTAKDMGLLEKIKFITTLDIRRGKIDGLRIEEVLVEEMTDARKTRQTLKEDGFGHINIIGIQ